VTPRQGELGSAVRRGGPPSRPPPRHSRAEKSTSPTVPPSLEWRVANPLLPLKVVRDRNRGGAFLAIGIVGVATFATFLFLSYYLQQDLGFSPIETGLAFLPMVAMVMLAATRGGQG
jgi:hypothetical protein